MNNRNQFGEVFTPIILTNEILDNLPNSVWMNPNLKWLDPCAGSGNMFIKVLERLNTGLYDIIPLEIERKKHIITRMLFMVEINPSNLMKIKEIFGSDCNIIIADFLDYIPQIEFDIVIGNPPFQNTKNNIYTGSSGNRTLWDKFLIKCINLIKVNGHLGFITPSNWRRPDHKLYTKMVHDNHLVFLHIYNKKDGLLYFNAQTRFDVYILKVLPSNVGDDLYMNTVIIDEKGVIHKNLDLSNWNFIPNYAYDIIRTFLKKDTEKGIDIIFDSTYYDARKLSVKKEMGYIHPIVHTLTKKGMGLKYANKKNTTIFLPKVILNFNAKQYPVNDYEGIYGMSQLSFGIPIKSFIEGDRKINIINSYEFRELLSATKWSSFQTDYRMFKYLNI
jgi:hypothetical protein